MFGLLPSSRAIVAVILIRVECQKGGNQDCKNYYNCRPHRVTRRIPAHCAISANPNTRHAKLVRSRNFDLNQVFAAPVVGHGPPGCVLDQSQCSLIETVLETAGVLTRLLVVTLTAEPASDAKLAEQRSAAGVNFAMRRRIGGMQWEKLMSSIAETTGLAPLRAKSGWIVALGVVYVIAGLIALGSVVFATVVTVFIVEIGRAHV